MTAADTVYFEDFAVDSVCEHGSVTVTEEAVKTFAAEFDPQPFHLDEAAAQRTHFGGLAASGWHTCAMMMRLLVDNCFRQVASLGSPGFDDLRWLHPVRPGDVLRVRATCVEKAPSRSRRDRGLVRLLLEVFNQGDVCVMSLKLMALVARRPSD